MSQLIQKLINEPEYRKMYIRFKVQVEHHKPHPDLFRRLPLQVAWELEMLYDRELKKWQRKQRNADLTEAPSE